MAKMIPSTFPSDTPVAERKIFDRLSTDPATGDWIAFHSLALPETQKGPFGEIDFVILVPEQGILCLEVKGGRIACRNGEWFQSNSKTGETKKLKKSPYQQSRDNMFGLKKRLEKHFRDDQEVARTLISCAVAFPGSLSPPENPESDKKETLDFEGMKKPISEFVIANLKNHRRKIGSNMPASIKSTGVLNRLKNYLRPDFERVAVRAATIHESEIRLIALTDEQYDYLDSIDANRRVLVRGAAGTGKTLLAIRYARAEIAQGKKVLLLCFNRLLAEWISMQFTREEQNHVVVDSIHRFMSAQIRKSQFAAEFADESDKADSRSSEIYSELMPMYAELALQDSADIFDTLIIDEAQDLMTTQLFSVLNAAVIGGLAGGRWAIFCDDSRQAIYGADSQQEPVDTEKLISDFCSDSARVLLKRNCRNTRPIGEETALMSGFDSMPYRLGDADGLPVDYRYWRNEEEHLGQLEQVLVSLEKEGVSPDEVVILGKRRLENTLIGDRCGPFTIEAVENLGSVTSGSVGYATIHSFKGLESPVIVLTGVSGIDKDEDRSLLYVGMSRARSHLVLMLKNSIKERIPELTRKKLSGDWSQ